MVGDTLISGSWTINTVNSEFVSVIANVLVYAFCDNSNNVNKFVASELGFFPCENVTRVGVQWFSWLAMLPEPLVQDCFVKQQFKVTHTRVKVLPVLFLIRIECACSLTAV